MGRLGCANKDLWALCIPISTIVVYCRTTIFWGVRNNWYQSHSSTIIEIGAQKSQSGPIAWPNAQMDKIENKKMH